MIKRKDISFISIIRILLLSIAGLLISACSDKEEIRSQLEICQNHYKAESYLVASKECQISAEQGIVEAQWLLGHIYRYNLLQQGEELKQAFDWYLLAAEQGHTGAMREVGNAYLLELGIAKDYSNAHFWLLKAAKNEDTLAEFLLGTMFFDGKGRDKDIASAINWFKRSATKGHSMSINNLAWVFATSKNKAFFNPKKANYWMKKMNKKMSKVPMFLDTQAAVMASLDDFDKAIELQNLAIANLPPDTSEQELVEFQKHLESYQQREVWHE